MKVVTEEAVNLLSLLVHTYRPKWHYEMGKVGYECAFCGAVIRSQADAHRADHHREDCAWIRARTWLATLEGGDDAR